MKTIMKLTLGAFVALATLGSCKDTKNEVEADTTNTEMTDMEMETTTAADTAVVDDNVPGTTSGEMEQVP